MKKLLLIFVFVVFNILNTYEKGIDNSKYFKDFSFNEKLISFIQEREGFSSVPYLSAGKWHIGYGHLILKDEKFDSLTKNQARKLLKKDLKVVFNNIELNQFNDNQKISLVSFVYNVGINNYRYSLLSYYINKDNNHYKIKKEFLKWVYITKVFDKKEVKEIKQIKKIVPLNNDKYKVTFVSKGLLNRRKIESNLYFKTV